MASNHETLLRQWQMLGYLPRYPAKITASILKDKLDSEQFSVSKRTIERDLMELSLVFPLALDSRSKPYGWSWQKDAPAFDLPGLSNNESLTLMLFEQNLRQLTPTSTLEVMEPYFKAARQRLSKLEDVGKIRWIDKVRTVSPNQPLLPAVTDPEVYQAVSEALLNDRQMKITYRPKSGDMTEYRIHPLAMVQRGAITYLYVLIFDYQDTRTLALHRIVSAEILNKKTSYPKNFNIDEEIAKGRFAFGEGNSIKLKAKFSATQGAHLYETPLSHDQTIDELPEGDLIITATVSNTPQLRWWILAMGDGVEVLKPQVLRNAIASSIRNMASHYFTV